MKAIQVSTFGGPEVLVLNEVPAPEPGEGQVRVKVAAAGVNFIDVYYRTGLYPAPGGLPFVIGAEGAGEVVAVGSGVSELRVGDRVAAVGRGHDRGVVARPEPDAEQEGRRQLAAGGIHSRDDLADLAVDELTEMTGIDEEAAKALIMKAREHWFNA